MRTRNIAVSFTISFPYGAPDRNGVCYSREAILKALSPAKGHVPIRFAPNEGETKTIGITDCTPYAIHDNQREQTIEFTVDGTLFFGGTECLVYQTEPDKTITDFEIAAFGASEA